jgi:hypothetical protein
MRAELNGLGRGGLPAALAGLVLALALALAAVVSVSAPTADAQPSDECPAGTTFLFTVPPQGSASPTPQPFSETVTIDGEQVTISGTVSIG